MPDYIITLPRTVPAEQCDTLESVGRAQRHGPSDMIPNGGTGTIAVFGVEDEAAALAFVREGVDLPDDEVERVKYRLFPWDLLSAAAALIEAADKPPS